MDDVIAQIDMDEPSTAVSPSVYPRDDDVVEFIKPVKAITKQDELIVVKKRNKPDSPKPKPHRYIKSQRHFLEQLEDRNKLAAGKEKTEFIDRVQEQYDAPVCPVPVRPEVEPQRSQDVDEGGDDAFSTGYRTPENRTPENRTPENRTPENRTPFEAPQFKLATPPSLQQMGIKYATPTPDLDSVEPDVIDEENIRRDWLDKVRRLRKTEGYDKTMDLADLTMNSDTALIKDAYARRVKEIKIEHSAKSYDHYLYMGFLAIELIASKVLSVDMSGFAHTQRANREAYRDVLFELGEEWYKPPSSVTGEKSEYPALVRLGFIILMNAAGFWVTKYMGEMMMGSKKSAQPYPRGGPPPDATTEALNTFLNGFIQRSSP